MLHCDITTIFFCEGGVQESDSLIVTDVILSTTHHFMFSWLILSSVFVPDLLHRRWSSPGGLLAAERQGDCWPEPVHHHEGTQVQHHHCPQRQHGGFWKIQHLCAQQVWLWNRWCDHQCLQARGEASTKCCGDELKSLQTEADVNFLKGLWAWGFYQE